MIVGHHIKDQILKLLAILVRACLLLLRLAIEQLS